MQEHLKSELTINLLTYLLTYFLLLCIPYPFFFFFSFFYLFKHLSPAVIRQNIRRESSTTEIFGLIINCTFIYLFREKQSKFLLWYFGTNFEYRRKEIKFIHYHIINIILVVAKSKRKSIIFFLPDSVALIYHPIEWRKFRNAIRNVVTTTASRPVFVEHAMFFQLRGGGF